jgi:hypothetical protein
MMNKTSLKRARARSIALIVLLCATDVSAQSRESIKLNENAFAFAAQLIKEGHVIADGRGAWGEHQPSAEKENEFIRLHGFGEYAKWHLGFDDRYGENTKRRYKFPYGDFKNVHRCGILAVQSRAGQYKHYDIENAAARLIKMISWKKGRGASPLATR